MRHSEMINSIVETEKRASEITETAKHAQQEIDARVAEQAEILRAKYLNIANAQIYEAQLEEATVLQKSLAEIDERIMEAAKGIDKKDRQNHDLWVSALVKRLTAM